MTTHPLLRRRGPAWALAAALVVGVGGSAPAVAATLVVGVGGSAPAVAAAATASAAPADVRGHVTDGDTVQVRVGSRVEKVRVIGVDTPELPHGCHAVQAKAATTKLVGGKAVILRADRTQPDRDRYGRLLRHVLLTDHTLLARRLIVNGFGREMTVGRAYAGRAAYRADQARAQAKKRGLWKGCRPSAGPPASRCTIKGNISSNGEKIYHTPGQRYYASTTIDVSRGERWFCSAAQARQAGWRPARV